MLTRRTLLATACAGLFVTPLAGFAQHVDLGVTEEPAADGLPEMPRRYMMEDTYGNVQTNEDYQGKFVLVYFGYTGCPDVCPTSLSTMGDMLDLLGDRADALVPLFVTVDPDRDTAKLLREYAAMFHARIVPLRGPKAYTDHMVKAFNARYEFHIEDPNNPKRYSVDHTSSMALLDPAGMLIKRFPHGTSAEDMARDIQAEIDKAAQ